MVFDSVLPTFVLDSTLVLMIKRFLIFKKKIVLFNRYKLFNLFN